MGKRKEGPASGLLDRYWGGTTANKGGEAHNELVDGIRKGARGTDIWATEERKKFHKGHNGGDYSK